MFKIVGQLRDGKMVVADQMSWFSALEVEKVRDYLQEAKLALAQKGQAGYIEVGSIRDVVTAPSRYKLPANPSIVRIPIDNCITQSGKLTLKGNEPFYILSMGELRDSQADVIINGVNLGRLIVLPLRCVPIRSNNPSDLVMRAACYFPKIDFLTIINVPRGTIGTGFFWVLCNGGLLFKLCGKSASMWGKEYVTSNWIYGQVRNKEEIKVLDLDDDTLSTCHLIDILERKGYVDIPMMDSKKCKLVYGKDGEYGKYFSYEGAHKVGTCFTMALYNAFRAFEENDLGYSYLEDELKRYRIEMEIENGYAFEEYIQEGTKWVKAVKYELALVNGVPEITYKRVLRG